MPQLFLIVPACGENAYAHFKKTIEKPWTISDLLKLGVELPGNIISKLSSVGEFRIWGCVQGVRGWDKAWEKLDEDCVVALYRNKSIVCWGRVFAKVHDPVLAKKLWGLDERGRTWEYVYFIRDLVWVSIPWSKVRSELGYKEDFVPQGHTIVAENKVRKLVEKYGSIEEFLHSLAGEGTVPQYNPYVLQGIKRLSVKAYLEVLGRIIQELLTKDEWSKTELMEHIAHIVTEKVSKGNIKFLVDPELPNDLRRLGFIHAGNVAKAWSSNQVARVDERVKCIKGVLDPILAASIAIAISVLSPETPCLKLLRILWEKGKDGIDEAIKSISKDLKASSALDIEDLKRTVEKEAMLLEEVKNVLRDAPKALLPLELWRMGS